MGKRYLVFGISIQLLLLTGSCESDINLFYESGDKPVVYCLLNPKDSIQYLRVSRSFIIRGNPEGQVISPDSLILDEDFYAYLEYEKPDGTREIHYFEGTEINQRDSGLFPGDGLIVLQTNCHVKGGKDYGLYVYFPQLPRLVAGTVLVVNPVEILDPNPLPGREVTFLEDQGYLLRWTNSIKFAVYQPVLRFIFLEGDKNFQIRRQVDIRQPLVYGDSENVILSSYLNGAGFINDLVASLTPLSQSLLKSATLRPVSCLMPQARRMMKTQSVSCVLCGILLAMAPGIRLCRQIPQRVFIIRIPESMMLPFRWLIPKICAERLPEKFG